MMNCIDIWDKYNWTPEPLPLDSIKALTDLPRNIVIAHRGTTCWAPEETEVAMRWARNVGADYLELDLQRTKDRYLVALHDESLLRTTNVALLFPERKGCPVSDFTLDELRQLDIGNWFNKANPGRAREEFVGQDILTLEDVVKIAEGYRIVRDQNGKRLYNVDEEGRRHSRYEIDPADNGNRPGIYPETKEPHLFPGIEWDLRNELERLGWYHPDAGKMKEIQVYQGKVGVGNTLSRVILQTFSDDSLAKLKQVFIRRIPVCFLLWLGEGPSGLKENTPEAYAEKINYGIRNGAIIVGPSIGGEPNCYPDLLGMWQHDMIRRAGMIIHPYTFDTEKQMLAYTGWSPECPGMNRIDGMFTNRADMSIRFYQKRNKRINLNSNVVLGISDGLRKEKQYDGVEDIFRKLGWK